jgi:hypothetical protein
MAEATTPANRVRALPPFLKVGAWVIGVALIGLIVQTVARLLGFGFDMLNASGAERGLIIVLSMAGLAMLMGVEQRPIADYGLAIPERWRARFGLALIAGLATLGFAYLLAAIVGATGWNASPEAGRIGKAALKAVPALPLAVVLTVIFPGYLLSMFRERHGRIVSSVVVGALFAMLTRFEDAGSFLEPASLRTLAGMTLAGVLLCQIRMLTGSVVTSAGLLVGWAAMRKFAKRSGFFPDAESATLPLWFAPEGDPRQSIFVWLALSAAILACAVVLAKRPQDAVIGQRDGVSESFRKFYPFANMGMFAPLDVWLAQLWRARFRIDPPYIPRAIAILVSALITLVTTLPERILAPLLLRRRPLDPVFIVGVHRSGTTHLQNLLALDPQFACARTFQVINPFGFLVTGWLIVPFLKAFSPWKRPMDSVAFGVFSPNEEEYAIANASGLSPDWAVRLPREIDRYERFTFPDQMTERERARWKRVMDRFVRKLVAFRRRRRPLLKNPYNTARVGLLRELYPDARFVHIHRDPYRVYRSNMHMASAGHTLFQVQEPLEGANYATRFLDNYARMEEAYYRDADACPDGSVVEVRFEDLDADALGTVRAVYEALGLEYTDAFDAKLRAYLDSIAGYRKNTFKPVDEPVRVAVNERLGDLFERWGRERMRAADGAPAGAGTR